MATPFQHPATSQQPGLSIIGTGDYFANRPPTYRTHHSSRVNSLNFWTSQSKLVNYEQIPFGGVEEFSLALVLIPAGDAKQFQVADVEGAQKLGPERVVATRHDGMITTSDRKAVRRFWWRGCTPPSSLRWRQFRLCREDRKMATQGWRPLWMTSIGNELQQQLASRFLEFVGYGLFFLIGIPEPYRSSIVASIGVATVIGFYGIRKHKTRDGVPIED